jgi:hypothetical protein
MMSGFIVVCNVYFSFELAIHGLLPMIEIFTGPLLGDTLTTLVHQSMEFIITLSLLCVVRPRDWPEYFGIGLLE